MSFQTKMILATLIACFVSFLGGTGIGFVAGMKFQKEYQQRKKTCSGYTVLDARHVINCKGDTIYYNWKKNIGLLKK